MLQPFHFKGTDFIQTHTQTHTYLKSSMHACVFRCKNKQFLSSPSQIAFPLAVLFVRIQREMNM